MTAAAEAALSGDRDASVVVVCDGDLGESAALLRELAAPIADGDADLAVAAFRHRVGGGFGVALRFARWAIRSRCGYDAGAPISGQRAMQTEVLRATLPFAEGFGMEVGMTIDAARAGYRITEVELDLAHRATGKTAAGFLHRGPSAARLRSGLVGASSSRATRLGSRGPHDPRH